MKTLRTIQIILKGCDHDLMYQKELCNTFLTSLVNIVEMRVIPESLIGSKNPVTFYCGGKNIHPEDAGVTGTVTLYESHAALHAWPNLGGFVCVVITSCKEFDFDKTVNWIADYLGAKFCQFETIIM